MCRSQNMTYFFLAFFATTFAFDIEARFLFLPDPAKEINLGSGSCYKCQMMDINAKFPFTNIRSRNSSHQRFRGYLR